MSKTKQRKLNNNGVEINYHIRTNNESEYYLLLIHGLSGNLKAWDRVAGILNKSKVNYIVVDLRAHGLSDKPVDLKQYDFSKFVEDIELILKKEDIKKVIPVGHCYGGMVAIEMNKNTKSIVGNILIETKAQHKGFKKYLYQNRLVFRALKGLASILPTYKVNKANDYTGQTEFPNINPKNIAIELYYTSPKAWVATMHEFFAMDIADALPSIKTKTLVLAGADDLFMPVIDNLELANSIEKANLQVIPDARHVLPLEHPEVVAAYLEDFYYEIMSENGDL